MSRRIGRDRVTRGAPLLDRPSSAVLFQRPSGPVSANTFLNDAQAAADALPAGRFLINLCQDRYAFAVAFTAGLIRGKTALLNGEPNALASSYPDCSVVSDEPVPGGRLPVTLLRPEARTAAMRAPPEIAADHCAAIVFTSGSTGAPVPHPKRWGALVARSRAAAAQFELAGGTVLGTVPPQHMYGFELTVLLPLHADVSSWCGPAFFPADVAAALPVCTAPRVLVTTPLQMRALLAGTQTGASHLVGAVISATAPLDPALAVQAEAAWQAPVLEIFGATECGSIASRRTVAGADWTRYPGLELEIGEEGTVVRAPFTEPVALSDVLEATATGFRLLGRRTDLVKLGGRRASLLGLNQVLTGLTGVDDGVFVVPEDLDQRSTARLVAVVVAPGRTGAGILAELRRVLDPVFLPRRVIQVQKLPRNALGKLPRQALLALVEGVD